VNRSLLAPRKPTGERRAPPRRTIVPRVRIEAFIDLDSIGRLSDYNDAEEAGEPSVSIIDQNAEITPGEQI